MYESSRGHATSGPSKGGTRGSGLRGLGWDMLPVQAFPVPTPIRPAPRTLSDGPGGLTKACIARPELGWRGIGSHQAPGSSTYHLASSSERTTHSAPAQLSRARPRVLTLDCACASTSAFPSEDARRLPPGVQSAGCEDKRGGQEATVFLRALDCPEVGAGRLGFGAPPSTSVPLSSLIFVLYNLH